MPGRCLILIATLLFAFPIHSRAQVTGSGTGICSQLINGKYHQVPCSNPPAQSPPPTTQTSPTGPTAEELDRQAREREAERLRKLKERKQSEEALKAAEEAAKEADFIRKRDEAVIELKGVDDSTRLVLKEISATDPKPCGPSLNAMVVDACDPGTDLPKGVSDAIEGVFTNSPRDLTDRVRKGFNAVMNRDWKLASVWFKDALSRDPTNEKLRSLAALADYDETKTKGSALRVPTDDDLKLLFPGDSDVTTPLGTRRPRELMIDGRGQIVTVPDDYRGATQTYVALEDNPNLVPVPTADDFNLLFPGSFKIVPRSKVPIYRLDSTGKLIELPLDYNGTEAVFVKSKTGKPIRIPVSSDLELLSPPSTKPSNSKQRRRI